MQLTQSFYFQLLIRYQPDWHNKFPSVAGAGVLKIPIEQMGVAKSKANGQCIP
jgi:hypothetical protein